MRRSVLAVIAVVLVGCGSGGAAPLASGAPPSLAAAASPSPIPSPVQPIVLSGTNSKVTDPIDVPPGNYRVSWQATFGHHGYGSIDNFVIYIQGQSKNLLVSAIIPTTPSGEVLFSSSGGSFILDVETSDATWQITFTWLSP